MRDPNGKQPKGRPLDYYLPSSCPDRPPRSSFPQWQPPGLSVSDIPVITVGQERGPFLSAADMYRQDSTPYGFTAQQYQYTNAHLVQAPPPAQPGRSLTTLLSPPSTQPLTSTLLDPRPPHRIHGIHSEMDVGRPTHGPPPPLPTPVSPPPRKGLHVQTDVMQPLSPEPVNGAANERPSIEGRPSLGSPRQRQRTLSQPNRGYPPGARRPGPASPPLPQPDPYSIASPNPRRANYPNPNDPFSVAGPRGYPLKQTKSNTTESSHRGHTHACVSLNRSDRIRLIKFPPNVVAAVSMAIETTWVRGVQSERDIAGAYEFQLRGNPWSGQGDEAVPARILMCEILSAIYHNGWELRMSTDISQKALDKDLLIFREGPLPPPCQFIAISFNDNDRLRIISGGGSSSGGALNSNTAPNDVINAIKNVWGGNIQKEQWKVQGVAWEFKLAGNPWWASGEDSVYVRIALLNMLDQLTALGWDFHASLDMTAGPGGATRNAGSDTDCWILKKPR